MINTIRLIGMAFVLFVIAFYGARWMRTALPLQPDARVPTFHSVDRNDPREIRQATSFEGDDNAARNNLRQEAFDAATQLSRAPCSDEVKSRYIEAATKYARAWLKIAPCVGTITCGSSDGTRIERARTTFGTPLDARVREAMQKAHETGVLAAPDFPKDAVIMVANMAADPMINPRSDQSTEEAIQDARRPPKCGPVTSN